jgi:hypothetical protein
VAGALGGMEERPPAIGHDAWGHTLDARVGTARAPPPGEISQGQAPNPAQNVQVLPACLPHSGMAFTSEQLLVANSLQLDFNGSGLRSCVGLNFVPWLTNAVGKGAENEKRNILAFCPQHTDLYCIVLFSVDGIECACLAPSHHA